MRNRNRQQNQGRGRQNQGRRGDPTVANMYRVANKFGRALLSGDKETLSEIVAYSGGQAGSLDSDLTAFSKAGVTKLDEIMISPKSHRAALVFMSGNSNSDPQIILTKIEGNIVHGWKVLS